jgi:hypothetical protein
MYSIPQDKVSGFYPVYELRRDKTGRPFRDILELRREKIAHFLLELPLLYRLGGYVAVRYEDLLLDGTHNLIQTVSEILGVDAIGNTCTPAPPQPERIGHRTIPDDFRKYVSDNVDRATERLLGYAT